MHRWTSASEESSCTDHDFQFGATWGVAGAMAQLPGCDESRIFILGGHFPKIAIVCDGPVFNNKKSKAQPHHAAREQISKQSAARDFCPGMM